MKNQRIEEQDLIDLGFEKNLVTAFESGLEYDYYYYTLNLLDGAYPMCLITNADDEQVKSGWYVELFDFPYNRFIYLQELTDFILAIKKVKYYGNNEN